MNVVLFAVLAIVAVIGALGLVLGRNSVHSALFLVVTLFCVAVLYLTLSAEFLAIVQVIVYAGAIMVLFLFVITLLNPLRSEAEEPTAPYPIWLAPLLGIVLLAEAAIVVLAGLGRTSLPAVAPNVDWADNVHLIGLLLYSQYLFPFEVTSILLLVAIVGATVLTKRRI